MNCSRPEVRLRILSSLLLVSASAVLAGNVFAQTVPAPVRASETEAAKDTVVLSPFLVSTERDVGFVATSSLAGGRLASDLKDTPVAYSVLTREFIDAVRYFQNGSSATGGTALRPRDGNVSSPARVATATLFSYSVPINWTLSARMDF